MDPKKEHLKKYLEELEQIESLLKKRKDESGILYYTPNPKQYKFHCSKAKRILYVGSNRSGKTESAMAELVMHATGLYPDWYPEHKRRDIPQKILWVSPTFEHIQNFVEPKFEKLVPKESIVGKPRRHSYGYLAQVDVRHKSGGVSQVFFKSQEQKLMSFEGSDYDIAISDEPLSRPLYSSIVRGLVDRGGVMIFTLTPIEQQWMKEELCDRADGKFIEMFVADIHDNLFDIKGKPILNKQYIKEFEDSIPEEEREIRIHGRWYHLSGIVFKEIEPSVHRIEDHKVPTDSPVISVTDPHDRNPHWTIWAYIDKTDDVYICGELIATGSPEEYTAKMLAHEKYMNWRVKRRIIDPNFGNKPKAVGSRIRVVDQFRSAGLRGLILGIDDDEAGKVKIREYLKYDKRKPVDISNKPKLYFFKDGARETYRAISNLQYDDWSKHLHDMKELKESVRDKNKHASDVIRYLLCSSPTYERGNRHEEDIDKPIY